MEREILFRGKQIDNDNGAWVKGCLINDDFIMPEFGARKIEKEVSPRPDILTAWVRKVVPETVCQYTGTPDKNGRKIFEGDIVRRKLFEEYIIGEVVWQDIGVCGFYLKCGNKYYPIGKDEYVEMSSCDEVIGNIFDNPELLKGDSNF